jgi:gliding motility-associated-like protein
MNTSIKYFTCFLLSICSAYASYAQFSVQINAPSTTVPCNNPCMNILASTPNLKKTDQYVVTPITYQSPSLVGGTPLSLGDDEFSASIPIGFTFCFYDQAYSNVIIGSNGILTFNSTFANQPCYTNTGIQLPFSNGTFPNRLVACPFIDIDPTASGGSIRYGIVGTAPTRKFIVEYINVVLFGATTSVVNNFYVSLHESTNIIEMHIGNKGVTSSTNPTYLDSAVLGIQNTTTSNFVCPPNRNGGAWSASNEAWRYTPNGANNYALNWFINGALNKVQPDSAVMCFTSGTNTLVVQYVNSCPSFTVADTLIVSTPTVSIASFNLTQPLCKYNKGSLTLTCASNNLPFTYQLNSGGFNANNTFNNLNLSSQAGVYTVTAKDNQGCATASTFLVAPLSNLNTLPTNIIASSCSGSNGSACVAYGNGFPPYSVLWSNGATTNCITGLPPLGIFGVTVTDSLGCKDSSSLFIPKQYPVIALDTLYKPLCPFEKGYAAVTASGTIAPYTYFWPHNNSTAQIASNLNGNTIYSVVVTDAGGCTTTLSIYVSFISQLQATLVPTKPTCDKANGSILVTLANGTPPYTYLWSNATTANPVTSLDSGFYFVTVKDSFGCEATASMLLADTLEMSLNRLVNNTKCGYNNGTALITPLTAMAPFTYVWAPAGPTGNNPTNLAPGNYIVTVTDALNCIKTTQVNVAPSPKINIGFNNKDPYCDSTNGIVAAVPSNGVVPYTYQWVGGPATASWNNVGPGTYSVLVTDALACTAASNTSVADLGSPKIFVASYVPPLCNGDSNGRIELLGSGGSAPYKYATNINNFTTGALITNIVGGSYTFYIKDANSCIKDTTIVLPVPPKINLAISPFDTLICYYDKIQQVSFNASGGFPPYSYKFDAGGFGPNNFENNVGIGKHKIFVLDSVLCERLFEIDVAGPPALFEAVVDKKNVECILDKTGRIAVTLQGGWGNYNYQWNTTAASLVLDSLSKGIYTLTAEDDKGCEITNEINLDRDSCCIAKVPNAFSPNEDTYNDDLGVIVVTPLQEAELRIFNRWGNLVYVSTNMQERWDGTYKNKKLDPDTYFYLLRFKCAYTQKEFVEKGDIMLLR